MIIIDEKQKSADAATLASAVEIIRAHQARVGCSTTYLLSQYPSLASHKTHSRLMRGDTVGLDLSRWAAQYLATAQLISAEADAPRESRAEDGLIEELSPTAAVTETVAELAAFQAGPDRLVIIEGGTGSGKTWALKAVAQRLEGMCIRVEASETWRSLNQMLRDLCVAAGLSRGGLPTTTGGLQAHLLAGLQSRKILLIDEAHHLTAQGLNTIKTLLNRTPMCIVMAGIDTLWRKLQASSAEEARQLIHNRMFRRLALKAPVLADVELFLRKRVPGLVTFLDLANPEKGALRPCIEVLRLVRDKSASRGGFAFLRRLTDILASQDELDELESGAGWIRDGLQQALADIDPPPAAPER
jgi:Rad3-related DNA helicase